MRISQKTAYIPNYWKTINPRVKVVAAVAFLASPIADYVSGATIHSELSKHNSYGQHSLKLLLRCPLCIGDLG